jgi:hypothetical protein
MSRSYFVRHTESILVRREDLERLWDENRIAIHFPGDTQNTELDSESLVPADYQEPYEKGAIGAFAELAEEDGYLWAQSYVSKVAKVGYVKGRREDGEGAVMDRDARWEMRGNSYPGREDGRPATLKTLQMERVVEIEKGMAMHLRVATPLSTPFSRWPSVGCRLRDLLEEGSHRPPEWSRLASAEQEAACAEFLRERHTDRPELPILKRLLLPVGRGMEDVDAYALTKEGNYLYTQVTHHQANIAEAKDKAARLGEYAGHILGGASLVFFCRGSAPSARDVPEGIYFVSVEEEVMLWILADNDYRRGLFGTAQPFNQ